MIYFCYCNIPLIVMHVAYSSLREKQNVYKNNLPISYSQIRGNVIKRNTTVTVRVGPNVMDMGIIVVEKKLEKLFVQRRIGTHRGGICTRRMARVRVGVNIPWKYSQNKQKGGG